MNLTPFVMNTLFNVSDYVVFPKVFDDQTLDYWVEMMEEHENDFEVAGVGGDSSDDSSTVPETRNGIVKWFNYDINDEFSSSLFREILNITQDINDNYFRFDLTGFEMIQYTKYINAGDHYTWHCDKFETFAENNPNTFACRKLSFSLLLNQQGLDFEEGTFWVNNSGNPIEVQADKGDLIAFPSFTLHKVAPIKSGERKSLVWWCQGPKFR
jgi:PKHD-type hydroxylase